jgi:hypothetical protein
MTIQNAIEDEIHQLIQFQIETFRQPVPLNSFQLQSAGLSLPCAKNFPMPS